MHLPLKEDEANLSSISPTAATLLPLTANPNRLLEKDAPNPLYGVGQKESGINSTVKYEPMDISEAENPMYAGTLPQESGTQSATAEQKYTTVENPMYTEPLPQQSSTQPTEEDPHESFEREVDNPLYTMRDDDDGFSDRGNSMEANPVYSDIRPHQYEYMSVPTPASTGEPGSAQ